LLFDVFQKALGQTQVSSLVVPDARGRHQHLGKISVYIYRQQNNNICPSGHFLMDIKTENISIVSGYDRPCLACDPYNFFAFFWFVVASSSPLWKDNEN